MLRSAGIEPKKKKKARSWDHAGFKDGCEEKTVVINPGH